MTRKYGGLYADDHIVVHEHYSLISTCKILCTGTLTQFYNSLMKGSLYTYSGKKLEEDLDRDIEREEGFFGTLIYIWYSKFGRIFIGL